MELAMLSISMIASLLVGVLSYIGVQVFYTVWWKPKSLEKQLRQQGIKGNSYRLLFGDLKEEIEVIKEAWSSPLRHLDHRIIPRVHPFVHRMVEKYGKTCMIWVGPTPRVVLWEPEMVREVLLDKSGHLPKPPVNPLIQLLSKGVFNLKGEEGLRRRKIITPAFHLEKLKGMMPAFLASCVTLIKRWDELTGSKGSCEVDVWPEFQNLTADVISQTAFGSSFEEGKMIFELQKEQAILVDEAARAPYIPGFKFIPTAKNRRRMFVDQEIKSTLRQMINRKLKSMKMGGQHSNDLLGLLLEFSNLTDQKNSTLTIEQVIEECKLFYFAGQETTSVWLTWTLVLLSMYPIWQQKAREEVLMICGKNPPDFESINHLKIVTMILHEVIRLYPPVISQVRRTEKKTKLGEYSFPAGIDFFLPTILFHHDPEYWGEDAAEFNPERFSDGVLKASKGRNVFFPFGWGPRICLGQNFATVEAKMALAIILQHFTFELAPSYTHAPRTILTLQPQHGARITLHQL